MRCESEKSSRRNFLFRGGSLVLGAAVAPGAVAHVLSGNLNDSDAAVLASTTDIGERRFAKQPISLEPLGAVKGLVTNHIVVTTDGIIYAPDCDGTLWTVDAGNVEDPKVIGSQKFEGTQCDISLVTNETLLAVGAADRNSITLLDCATTPDSPKVVTTVRIPDIKIVIPILGSPDSFYVARNTGDKPLMIDRVRLDSQGNASISQSLEVPGLTGGFIDGSTQVIPMNDRYILVKGAPIGSNSSLSRIDVLYLTDDGKLSVTDQMFIPTNSRIDVSRNSAGFVQNVFVNSGDRIDVFDLQSQADDWRGLRDGFTRIAHIPNPTPAFPKGSLMMPGLLLSGYQDGKIRVSSVSTPQVSSDITSRTFSGNVKEIVPLGADTIAIAAGFAIGDHRIQIARLKPDRAFFPAAQKG